MRTHKCGWRLAHDGQGGFVGKEWEMLPVRYIKGDFFILSNCLGEEGNRRIRNCGAPGREGKAGWSLCLSLRTEQSSCPAASCQDLDSCWLIVQIWAYWLPNQKEN